MTNPTIPNGMSPFPPAGSWGPIDDLYVHAGVSTGSWTSAPQPTPTPWEEKPGSYYFEDPGHAQYFESRRLAQKAYHLGSNTPWDEHYELKLVNKLNHDWFDEPWQGNMAWDYEDLNLDALPVIPLRKHDLKPFKINYETIQEAKLRLNNTVIAVKGHPFNVKSVIKNGGNFMMALSDGEKMWKVKYADLQDLRSIPAMYLNLGGVGWLCRHPGRVYQQGINKSNTLLRTVDGSGLVNTLSNESLVMALKNRKNTKWDTTIHGLMTGDALTGLRLSDTVAVKKEKGKILACYKGRRLGFIEDNEVRVFDEDDLLQEWIEQPVRDAGLELRAA